MTGAGDHDFHDYVENLILGERRPYEVSLVITHYINQPFV
jgi:hypothetical protein